MHSACEWPGLCVSSLHSWPVVIKRLSGKDAMLSQQWQVRQQRRKRERFFEGGSCITSILHIKY